jgi:hypothetical protein
MGAGKKLVGIVEGCSVPQVFIPKLLEYYQKVFPLTNSSSITILRISISFEDALGRRIKAILKNGQLTNHYLSSGLIQVIESALILGRPACQWPCVGGNTQACKPQRLGNCRRTGASRKKEVKNWIPCS